MEYSKLFHQKDLVSYAQLTILQVQKTFTFQPHKFVGSIYEMGTKYLEKFVHQKKMSGTMDYYPWTRSMETTPIQRNCGYTSQLLHHFLQTVLLTLNEHHIYYLLD